MDVPLCQNHLSCSIDEASYLKLVTGGADNLLRDLDLMYDIPMWVIVAECHPFSCSWPPSPELGIQAVLSVHVRSPNGWGGCFVPHLSGYC